MQIALFCYTTFVQANHQCRPTLYANQASLNQAAAHDAYALKYTYTQRFENSSLRLSKVLLLDQLAAAHDAYKLKWM